MSVGSATDCSTTTIRDSSNSPAICYGSNGSSSLSKFEISSTSSPNLSWNGSGGGTNDFFTLKQNSGSGNPVNITFKFSDASSTANSGTNPSGSLSDETYTITMGGKISSSGESPVLKLQSLTNGIDMQRKTLTFDFGSAGNTGTKDSSARKMILDLTGTTNYKATGNDTERATSLIGDIVISGGRAQLWYGENQFEATFGGDMIGNITIKNNNQYTDIKSTFNFNNSASLYGDITVSTGTNTFNFSGSTNGQNSNDTTITGDITTTATLYANAKSIFKFNSSGTNTINGNITAEQVAWAGSNELTFTAGTNIINGNITTIYKAGGNSTPENKITSNSSSTSFTINGSVQADVGGKNTLTLSTGENKINAKDTVAVSTEGGTNTINFSGGTTASIAGDITASVTNSNVAGTNTITFGATTTNTIQGNIKAERYGTTASSNSITFSSGSASIVGGISNTGNGTNKIDFQSGTTTAQITGNVTARGGTNTITFSSASTNSNSGTFNGSSTNTIDGYVSVNGGSNDIFFGSRPSTGTTKDSSITASGSATSEITQGVKTRDGKNTIVFATNGNATIGKDSDGNSIKTVDGGAIGATTISFYGSGTNKINGNIYVGNVGFNISKTNTISFSNGTNTITGDIRAQGSEKAVNSITFTSSSANTITGSIKAEGGVNQISFSGQSITIDGSISSTGGRNVISLNDSSLTSSPTTKDSSTSTTTLKLSSITSSGSGANYLGKSILSSSAGSNSVGTLTTQGIDASNWWTNDTYAFTGSLSITEIKSSGNGGNYISYKADSNTNSAIISNLVNNSSTTRATTLGTAISGNNNNLYLDVSGSSLGSGVEAIKDLLASSANTATTTSATSLQNATVILGHIQNSGTTNIKIIGKANETSSSAGGSSGSSGSAGSSGSSGSDGSASSGSGSGASSSISTLATRDGSATTTTTNHNQIGILGNIINDSGTTNVVLQDTFFAPSEMIVTSNTPSTRATVPVGGTQAGNITTASGATTNFVTRFTNAPTPSGTSMYGISGAGTTNVVIQGNVDVGTNINYTKGSAVNLIFAASSSNANTSTNSISASASSVTDDFTTGKTELSGNESTILGVTYQDGVKLAIKDKTILIGDSEASFLDTYSSYYSDGSTPLATVWANRTDTEDTVSINGLVVGDIYSLAQSSNAVASDVASGTSGKTYNVTLNTGSAFAGNISLDASTTSAVNIVMNAGSKLILADASDSNRTTTSANNFVISTLNIKEGSVDTYQLQTETLKQSNTVINIATGGASANNVASREDFRLLTIGGATATTTPNTSGGLTGNGEAVFMTYVNTNANQNNATLGGVSSTDGQYGNLYSDRIIIANIGDNSKAQSGTYYMQFAVDANSKLGSVTYNASNDNSANSGGTKTAGNIAVLTVVNTGSNGSKQAGITLKTQDVLQGFDQIGGDLVAIQTDINGVYDSNGAYTTYFINNLTTRGATQATQEVTASAFATNYDLYMANFNSLNKRMGELRENNHSQGVWARVFTGSQTNDFSKSKSTYTTVQGGYDYALGMEGANNYIGLAVAYAMSSSKSNLNALDITGTTKNIENIKSNAVEVAVYNSYVQDEGWYNDSIAKFSYIFSDFNITGQESTYSTNNMAFTLSDEFGYRFKLGSEKEWMIDPQLEVAFGYFNQSDFIQTLGLSSLEGVAEGIFTTRARLGSSFGYDFKKFTQGKGIKASVYVGAFYEYDYVTGGDIRLTTNLGGETTSSSAISSDGRVVMNVGTNVEIYDNTRIYFDFESSFAGKIRTDYQVNIGARYSFGESNGYTPAVAKAKEVAPLKVEEVKNTQENQAQESKTTQESK